MEILIEKEKSKKLSCIMISCKKCKVKIFRDEYWTHVNSEHKPKMSIEEAKKMIDQSLDKYGNLIINGATQPAKGGKYLEPFGLRVIAGFARAEKFKADSKENCSCCGQHVTYLSVGESKHKAFDVDKSNYITGTHACGNVRGDSLYAFSGGAIDSNRRRH